MNTTLLHRICSKQLYKPFRVSKTRTARNGFLFTIFGFILIMEKLLFHTKDIWVRYSVETSYLCLTFPNEPLPKGQSMGTWTWRANLANDDYCVVGKLISKTSFFKILRILKNYFGVHTNIKVYSESEYDSFIFQKNMKEIESLLTADEKYAAVKYLSKWLSGENLKAHFDNVLGNAAAQMGRYGNAEWYADGFTQYWVKPYVNYVLSFR